REVVSARSDTFGEGPLSAGVLSRLVARPRRQSGEGGRVRIAIVGCGAIGGYVGGKLALAGEAGTLMVRGATLQAVRERGITLHMSDGSTLVARNVTATSDYAGAGAQHLVILAVKAHQLEAVARQVPELFGPDTIVVTMQNGIPYWYFHRHGGALEGSIVRS